MSLSSSNSDLYWLTLKFISILKPRVWFPLSRSPYKIKETPQAESDTLELSPSLLPWKTLRGKDRRMAVFLCIVS